MSAIAFLSSKRHNVSRTPSASSLNRSAFVASRFDTYAILFLFMHSVLRISGAFAVQQID